jgi:Zn-dependent protease/CBS domain-containing protein
VLVIFGVFRTPNITNTRLFSQLAEQLQNIYHFLCLDQGKMQGKDRHMKWSWKIARVAGIDIYMHSTFLLLIGWVAISSWLAQKSVPALVESIGFLLVLFACVVLHEYGHALTARRYGIQTRDITLLPIGGVARLERMPDKPVQEFWVALAGPAVNLFIAIILLIVLLATGTFSLGSILTVNQGSFIERILAVNLSLLLFNLIPAFPMDGGRVVRALLATRMEYTRATQIAAMLGQGAALVLGFFGLFNNPFLLFIALFVWIGAAQEASMVQVKSALSGIPVSRAMLTEFHSVSPTDPLSRPIELLLSGSQHDFPVVANGAVVGMLVREDLIHALAQFNESMFVSHIMRKEFKTIDSAQMLEAITQQMQEAAQNTLPVLNHGELVGLINLENIGEFLMIQNAVKARKMASS